MTTNTNIDNISEKNSSYEDIYYTDDEEDIIKNNQESNSSFIDSLFIKPKLIYFSVASSYYGLYMFRGDLCKKYLNLKTDQFGTLSSIIALVGFIFMPLWSSLADRLGRHRMVIIFLCLAMSASIQLAPMIKGIENEGKKYIASILFMSLYSLFSCGILPITDYIILKMIENNAGFSRDLYGRQRLWGTISYGITTLIVGFFSNKYGLSSLLYVLPLIVIISTIILCLYAPKDSNPLPFRFLFCGKKTIVKDDVYDSNFDNSSYSKSSEPSSNENSKSKHDSLSSSASILPSLKSPLKVLLTTPSYVFMLMVVFMTGSARAVMTTFLNVYWGEDLKFDATNRGWLATIGIIFEVIIFFNSQKLLGGLGIYWMFIIAQIATVLRCYAYYVLPTSTNFFFFCLVELLKGVSFGFTQSAGVKLAGDVCPPGLESTAQAVYTAVYSQLPAVISAYCGGVVYEKFGAHRLFLGISVISIIALILCTFKYYYDGHILISSSLRGRRSGGGIGAVGGSGIIRTSPSPSSFNTLIAEQPEEMEENSN